MKQPTVFARRQFTQRVVFCAGVLALTRGVSGQPAEPPTVGIEGRLEITATGLPLEARPVTDRALLVVRIASAVSEGDATRYDVRYIGALPGKYDLREYLVRRDGSAPRDLPPQVVTVAPLLPEEHDGGLSAGRMDSVAVARGYRIAFIVAWVFWALLAIPLILYGRKRREEAVETPPPRPPTLAERMRPLVLKAAEGNLSPGGKAQLERLLLSYWCTKLDLDRRVMAESLATLRRHPEGGVLLRALEEWLHRPPGTSRVDVAALLAPYRDIPAPPEEAVS